MFQNDARYAVPWLAISMAGFITRQGCSLVWMTLRLVAAPAQLLPAIFLLAHFGLFGEYRPYHLYHDSVSVESPDKLKYVTVLLALS